MNPLEQLLSQQNAAIATLSAAVSTLNDMLKEAAAQRVYKRQRFCLLRDSSYRTNLASVFGGAGPDGNISQPINLNGFRRVRVIASLPDLQASAVYAAICMWTDSDKGVVLNGMNTFYSSDYQVAHEITAASALGVPGGFGAATNFRAVAGNFEQVFGLERFSVLAVVHDQTEVATWLAFNTIEIIAEK